MTRGPSHSRLLMLTSLAGLPGVVVSLVFLFSTEMTTMVRGGLVLLVAGAWLGVLYAAWARSRFHLQTLSNLLAALREGDFSFRVRGGRRGDAYGELVVELNALAEIMRRQRVDDLEATALLRKVMAEIDVAVLAFDAGNRLRMVNTAGERLLAGRSEELLGASAATLGIAQCLGGPPARTITLDVAGASKRWEMRRGAFRQLGHPRQLIVLQDVSRALRAEELAAWKRLLRVIGHELNNSLAPIRSIAGSLERLTGQDPLPSEWRDDLHNGLRVISSRADALNRFMGAYSKLAKMPEPTLKPVDVGACVHRVARLETRCTVAVRDGPPTVVQADQDQLEQLLINLVRNGVDASLESGGSVTVGWESRGLHLQVWVTDDGPGLPDSANLFVPFFTTKPEGSGIGLFLCRQIAEAHGGGLTLRDRSEGPGCEARLDLPGVVPPARNA